MIASNLPSNGKLISVEFSSENAAIAREVIEHAGLSSQVKFIFICIYKQLRIILNIVLKVIIIEGTVQTVLQNYLLEVHIPTVDMSFIDHDKAFYLPDLHYLLDNSILKAGSVVVADNILVPGAPEYREYVNSSPRFRTVEYTSHLEYVKAVKDIVSVSEIIY